MADKEWYADGLRFECTQCGKCCTGPPGFVWFTDEEAEAIAAQLGVTVDQFTKDYTHKAYGRLSLKEVKRGRAFDCVFLERDGEDKALCSIYSVRPKQCRTWPFWEENLESPKTWERTKRVCPGSGNGKLYPVEQIRILRDETPTL